MRNILASLPQPDPDDGDGDPGDGRDGPDDAEQRGTDGLHHFIGAHGQAQDHAHHRAQSIPRHNTEQAVEGVLHQGVLTDLSTDQRCKKFFQHRNGARQHFAQLTLDRNVPEHQERQDGHRAAQEIDTQQFFLFHLAFIPFATIFSTASRITSSTSPTTPMHSMPTIIRSGRRSTGRSGS